MIDANDFAAATDNETLELAVANRGKDGIVLIPPRVSSVEPERDDWLLDRAVLLPSNTTVVLQNCKIKLSDKCRDNFFRSANCGMGIENPERAFNIHVRGEGQSVLEGADHPRASGDSGKLLRSVCPHCNEDLLKMEWVSKESKAKGEPSWEEKHLNTYGTDAGKEGESQYGDWRNIGILLACVEHFSIENVEIKDAHGWGISLEDCSDGYLNKISFDARMSKEIDGMLHNIENQDGIDLRNGCHDIAISNITGRTGDDVIALTAIARTDRPYRAGGSLKAMHVMHNDWTKREPDIYNVIIDGVRAYSCHCRSVRLLSAECRIYNVIVNNIVDTDTSGALRYSGVLLGDGDHAYGKNLADGLCNIIVSNVIANGKDDNAAVEVHGYLKDSVISNVMNRNPKAKGFLVCRENALNNVKTENVLD